jgi:hypothetical protein
LLLQIKIFRYSLSLIYRSKELFSILLHGIEGVPFFICINMILTVIGNMKYYICIAILKVNIIRKNIKPLFILFLPVYLLIVHQSLQNKHAHFYPNGVIVVHAHPVSHQEGIPINEHSHSKTEICFYHIVKFDYYTLSAEIVVEETQSAVTSHIVLAEAKYRLSPLIQHHDTRGPPAILV